MRLPLLLRSSRIRDRQVFDRLPGIAVLTLDRNRRFVAAEGGALASAGWDRERIVGFTLDELFPADRIVPLRTAWDAALAGERVRMPYRTLAGDTDFELEFLPVSEGAMCVVRDVTGEQAAQARLQESERAFRLLIENAEDVIARCDLDGVVRYVTPSCRALLGRPPSAFVGETWEHAVHPHDVLGLVAARTQLIERGSTSTEFRMVHADQTVLWVQEDARLVRDAAGTPVELHTTLRDVTRRRNAEARLERLATHDPLTDLFNRRRFEEALEEELVRVRRHHDGLALLRLRLDGLPGLNEAHGHPAGDALLLAAAEAIGRRLRAADCAGRLAGDEFAVLLRGIDPAAVDRVAADFRAVVGAATISLRGQAIAARATVGFAVATEPLPSAAALIDAAGVSLAAPPPRALT